MCEDESMRINGKALLSAIIDKLKKDAAAPAGFVNVAASGTTVVVNTTAVTATSTILVQEDPSLSTALSVTCNATAATAPPTISARTAGTSFTITTTAPTTNPRCFSYAILN